MTVFEGKSLLIFDLDGTIADTSHLHAEAFRTVLDPLGVEVDYPSIAGLTTLDAMAVCLRSSGREAGDEELAQLTSEKQRRVRSLIAEKLAPVEGALEFLEWAAARYRLALCSSGSRGTVRLSLVKLGIAEKFDPVVCAEDVVKAKPDPECFRRVLELSGVAPAHALIFEDSESGVQAALASGCDVVRIGELAGTDPGAPGNWSELLAAAKRSAPLPSSS